MTSLITGPDDTARCAWVGDDAESHVTADQEPGRAYFYEQDIVTLPWGDSQPAYLAVPIEWAPKPVTASAERVLDPVCGMRIFSEDAAATSVYNGTTVYFCAAACKQRFDADPARYIA